VIVPGTAGLSVPDLFKQTLKELKGDRVAAFAGHLTYLGLFAIFPFLVFLFSLLGIFGAEGLVNELLGRASATVPKEALDLVEGPIRRAAEGRAQAGYTVGALIAILGSLWAVSGAMRATMDAMNQMYDVEDRRGLVKRYLTSIGLSLVVALLLIAALVLVVGGTAIAEAVARATGAGRALVWTWSVLQWPVLAAFVAGAFGLIYYAAPDVKQRWRWLAPGTVLALGLWLVFSLAFSLYVNNFGKYNAIYGALAGVAILMLYMYYSSFILLIGAEMNQVIERHIPGGKRRGERQPEAAPQPVTRQMEWAGHRT
jgi:membrane protein